MTFEKVNHLLGKVTNLCFAFIRKIEQIILLTMNDWVEFADTINVGYSQRYQVKYIVLENVNTFYHTDQFRLLIRH